MGDPTQQDPTAPPDAPATNQQPGAPHDSDSAGIDDDDDLDDDDDTLDPAMQETMIENLIARVVSMRQHWAMLERERDQLRRALRGVERERDALRAEHARALRRAELAEHQLAEVQGRIAALEDSLQQRRRGRRGSAKLAGPGHDVGQDFK